MNLHIKKCFCYFCNKIKNDGCSGSSSDSLSSGLQFYIKIKKEFGIQFMYAHVIAVAQGIWECSQFTLTVPLFIHHLVL